MTNRREFLQTAAALSAAPLAGRAAFAADFSLPGMLHGMILRSPYAHARIKELLDQGKPMPDYLRNHPVYYAGPAKTPSGMASGSFGPTTAGRMDSYVEEFQAALRASSFPPPAPRLNFIHGIWRWPPGC